jgi:hypothetical protein
MDLQNQAGRLSAGGRAECWSNDRLRLSASGQVYEIGDYLSRLTFSG